jgi:hypothetical protein
MIQSIGLVRTRDLVHIDRLICGVDDARLAAGFKCMGLVPSLYGGKPAGRVRDLSHELARMRCDALLFWVYPEAVTTIPQLTFGLQHLRPAMQIFWWGPFSIDSFANTIAEAGAQALDATVPEEVIPKLIVAGYIAGDAPVHLPSPYMSELLAIEDVGRLGLTAHQQPSAVVEELNWLTEQGAINGATVRIDGTRLSSRGLADLCEALANCPDTPKLELHVSVECRPSGVANLLSRSRIVKVVLYGAEADKEREPLSSVGIDIGTAAYPEQDAAQTTVRARNGFIASQTGIFPSLRNRNVGIHHLELPLAMERDRRCETYRWAARHLNLSSAAVLNSSVPLPLDEMSRFRLPIAKETGGWPKHTYLVTTGEDGQLMADGRPDASFAVRFLSLSQLGAERPQGAALTVLKIRTDADVAALEERLARFHSTGGLDVFHPNQPTIFENSCRWSRHGGCSVLALPRVSVESDGRLVACRDAGRIGTVGDDYDRILLRLSQDQQLFDVRRQCSICPVRDECSHCMHLPGQWGSRYCEIRKANPQTALYFEVNAFPFLVQRMLPHADGAQQATVSSTGLPFQHYDGPVGEPRKGTRPIIISLCERNFAWWRATSRITRLSGPLALVLEGWWVGATEPDLQQALCVRFSVDPAVAESGLKEALLKLRQGGLLSA